MKDKLNIAIEFLKEKGSFTITDNLKVGYNAKNDSIYIMTWITYPELKYLTKEMVVKEMEILKSKFHQLLKEHEEFKSFLSDKKIEYRIAYNYGMGSIGLCLEFNKNIEWLYKF